MFNFARHWMLPFALAFACLGGQGASAQTTAVMLTDYHQSTGRPGFFTGRLLTADDLSDEQQYESQRQRFLPDSELALDDLFESAGRISLVLYFDGPATDGRDPTNPNRPFADDFILLDDTTGQWRGWVYLPDETLVFDLEGTYIIPEPATLGPLALAAAALIRRRT